MRTFETLCDTELRSIALFDNAYHVYREALDTRLKCKGSYIRERMSTEAARALVMLDVQQKLLGCNPRSVLSLEDYGKAVEAGIKALGVIV